MDMITIQMAIERFIDTISLSRSQKTLETYRYGLQVFSSVLKDNKIEVSDTPIENLSEDSISWLLVHLKSYSPATERLYVQSAVNFFEFLAAERLQPSPNLARIRLLVRQRSRRTGQRLPQFPREGIEKIIQDITPPPHQVLVQEDLEKKNSQLCRILKNLTRQSISVDPG